MTEAEALLAAIEAHPDDDTPRLAYADWLDEQDEPIQAELIRVQCAIAALDAAAISVRNAHVHLWRRQQDLLEYHRHELLGSLADVIKPLDAVFERGFLTEITLAARAFVANAACLSQWRPRPVIRVTGAAEAMPLLSNCPDAYVISCLEMRSSRSSWGLPLDDDNFPRLFRQAKHWSLRRLDLSGCFLSDPAIDQLVEPDQPHWPLNDLDLSWNEFTDSGVRRLVESPLFPRLERLSLEANIMLTNDSARLLAAAAGQLKHLNVSRTSITGTGQQLLLSRKGTKIDLF